MPDGSPDERARLSRGLRALQRAARSLTKLLAAEALTQVQLGFREGRNPYGRPWPQPSSRPGGRPLSNKGRLRASFSARASGTEFTVGTNIPWVTTHQYGAVIRPKRAKALSFKVQVMRVMTTKRAQKITKLALARTRIAQGQSAIEFGSQAAALVERRYRSATKSTRTQRIYAQQVTIPRRQMLPEDELGPIWDAAFRKVGEDFLARLMR